MIGQILGVPNQDFATLRLGVFLLVWNIPLIRSSAILFGLFRRAWSSIFSLVIVSRELSCSLQSLTLICISLPYYHYTIPYLLTQYMFELALMVTYFRSTCDAPPPASRRTVRGCIYLRRHPDPPRPPSCCRDATLRGAQGRSGALKNTLGLTRIPRLCFTEG